MAGQSLFEVLKPKENYAKTGRYVAYLVRKNNGGVWQRLAIEVRESDWREFNPDGGDMGLPDGFWDKVKSVPDLR